MAGLNAGDLDREILLQTATKIQDAGTGEEVITWPVTDTLWANWTPTKGTELFLTQQRLGAQIDGKFQLHDLPARPTASGNRVVFDGRAYDIQAVLEIGRGDGLELWVSARAD